jgi:hypothetical protein
MSYNVVTEMRHQWRGRKPEALIQYVGEGALMPFGYGIAWRDWRTAGAFYMPVPLNLVVNVVRRAYMWARVSLASRTKLDEWRGQAFREGEQLQRQRQRRWE